MSRGDFVLHSYRKPALLGDIFLYFSDYEKETMFCACTALTIIQRIFYWLYVTDKLTFVT